MYAKKTSVENINLGLSVLQNYIRPLSKLNLQDTNVQSEDFVRDILNALHGWKLKRIDRSTFPGIDLLDENAKIGVQVTVEEGAPKVNDALQKIQSHHLCKLFSQFYHFMLIPKQSTYAVHAIPPGITFNWKTDVLDFDSILQKVQKADDEKVVEAVERVVVKALPKVFAHERDRLRTLRDLVHASLTLFNREAFRAPFNQEDPVEMYDALVSTRVSLQTQGLSAIAHPEVAANCGKAITILAACTGEVKVRFPVIHEAWKAKTRAQYKDDEWGESIRLMMAVRQNLDPLLDANDKILKDIDRKLSRL